MFGAISATNEAILRAKTEQELYQLVCDAAVHSAESTATVVLPAEPDSIWLKPAAGTGEIVQQLNRTHFSIDPDNMYGRGICGNAFRTQKACINSDILNSAQGRPWHELGREVGVMAGVALPLIKAGKSVGVLLFLISKSWACEEEIIALMARIAENVSVALNSFDRASEKAKTEAQKECLGRMFAGAERDNIDAFSSHGFRFCAHRHGKRWFDTSYVFCNFHLLHRQLNRYQTNGIGNPFVLSLSKEACRRTGFR